MSTIVVHLFSVFIFFSVSFLVQFAVATSILHHDLRESDKLVKSDPPSFSLFLRILLSSLCDSVCSDAEGHLCSW